MTRPDLRQIPLDDVLPLGKHPGQMVVTMSEGQWDVFLGEAYRFGCVLLELDDSEIPVRAWQKEH